MGARMFRKGLVIGIIILMLGVNIGSTFAGDVEVKTMSSVGFDGNTLYVGGSGPNNYTTIQSAINDAVDGDTVFVYDDSSPYYENVVVDKSINLVGENRYTTVIDGVGSGDVVYISSDSVNISGFMIQNSGGNNYDAGITIYSDSNVITDNNVSNNNYFGISLLSSNKNIISENNIYFNFRDGITLWECNNNNVTNNNIISNSVHGVRLNYCNNNTISNNTIKSNILDGVGLYSDNNHNVITKNTISDNYYGIVIGPIGTSESNVIFHNNIVNNMIQGEDESTNTWNDTYPSGGNYWSDYYGVDNFSGPNQNIPGSDGIGDTPYDLPCEYATDWYPLMSPYGQTELEIGCISSGLFKINAEIRNIGDYNALGVNWSIKLDGGFIIFGKESSGNKPYFIPAGESITISSGFILMLGFGPIEITVTASALNAEKVTKTVKGYLFLFFVILK